MWLYRGWWSPRNHGRSMSPFDILAIHFDVGSTLWYASMSTSYLQMCTNVSIHVSIIQHIKHTLLQSHIRRWHERYVHMDAHQLVHVCAYVCIYSWMHSLMTIIKIINLSCIIIYAQVPVETIFTRIHKHTLIDIGISNKNAQATQEILKNARCCDPSCQVDMLYRYLHIYIYLIYI